MRLAEHKHTYMDTHQSITCMNCRLFLADSTIQVQLAERELAAAGWKRRLEDSDDYARAKGRANSKVAVCVRERESVCVLCVYMYACKHAYNVCVCMRVRIQCVCVYACLRVYM